LEALDLVDVSHATLHPERRLYALPSVLTSR
jgi:hypothetical protein